MRNRNKSQSNTHAALEGHAPSWPGNATRDLFDTTRFAGVPWSLSRDVETFGPVRRLLGPIGRRAESRDYLLAINQRRRSRFGRTE